MGLLGPAPHPQAQQQQPNGLQSYYSTDETSKKHGPKNFILKSLIKP